jgi:hypothetical protein
MSDNLFGPILADIKRRNAALAAARQAAVPEVGIFWLTGSAAAQLNGQRILFDAIPWTEGEPYGGIIHGRYGHYDYWPKLQKLFPVLRSMEYTDFPRGRVFYHKTDRKFFVYSSLHFVRVNAAGRRLVLKEFRLPLAQTFFGADAHYEDPTSEMFD